METANARHHLITAAIAAELDRQNPDIASSINVEALAAAIERSLAHADSVAEGKRPDELNATNDG